MRWLALTTLAACTPPAPDLSAVSDPAERDCVEKLCPTGDLAACRAGPCAPAPAIWVVAPSRIRVAEGAVLVEAQLRHHHARFGMVEVEHSHNTHVGVTVTTTDGREIDLSVQTLMNDGLEQPFLFAADVDGEVQDVLIGAWDRKIEPCDVDRSGCRDFGFVLDGSLASWPPRLYTDGKRQRIPPAAVKFAVENGGAPGDVVRKLAFKLIGGLGTEVAAFGSTIERASTRLTSAPVTRNELRYGDPRDAVLADLAVSRAALDAELIADPTVDGFVLRVAGTPARHACAVAACPTAEGEALAECLATSCP